MEQLLVFVGNHPILTGAFAVVLAMLIATEAARLMRRWKELDTNEAIRLINREDPIILDVSNSTDYARGHIIHAEHMPPSRIEAGNQKLLRQKQRPILLYCKNGQVSPQMAGRLSKLGFEQVYVLAGGLAKWIDDNQPVSRGKAARKSTGEVDSGGEQSAGKNKKKGGKNKGGRKSAGKDGMAARPDDRKDRGLKNESQENESQENERARADTASGQPDTEHEPEQAAEGRNRSGRQQTAG